MEYRDLQPETLIVDTSVIESCESLITKVKEIKKRPDGGKDAYDMWGGKVGTTPEYELILEGVGNGKKIRHTFYRLDQEFCETDDKVVKDIDEAKALIYKKRKERFLYQLKTFLKAELPDFYPNSSKLPLYREHLDNDTDFKELMVYLDKVLNKDNNNF